MEKHINLISQLVANMITEKVSALVAVNDIDRLATVLAGLQAVQPRRKARRVTKPQVKEIFKAPEKAPSKSTKSAEQEAATPKPRKSNAAGYRWTPAQRKRLSESMRLAYQMKKLRENHKELKELSRATDELLDRSSSNANH